MTKLIELLAGKKIVLDGHGTDRQRIILTVIVMSTAIIACIFFILVDIFVGDTFYVPFYLIIIIASISAIYLERTGSNTLGRYVFLVPTMVIITFFTLLEGYETGLYMYYIPFSIYAFSAFGYEKSYHAFIIIVFNLSLVVGAYLFEFSFVPDIELSQSYIEISFISNFLVALSASILIVFYLMRINLKSQEKLVRIAHDLAHSKEKFELAIEGSNAGIWEWNGEDDTITISPQIAELLGYSHDDIKDLSMERMIDAIHPDDRQRFKDVLVDHFGQRKPFKIECRFRTFSSEYRWVLDTGQAEWNKNGRVTRMVGTILDINERKEAEKKIQQQNQLLEKTNEELDRFVYSTSHDLKAPLSSVLGLIQIAEISEEKEEVSHCFNLMKQRIQNLNTFIADIIDYSRNSRLAPEKERVDLKSLLDDIISNLEYYGQSEHIDIRQKLEEGLQLVTDAGRLKIILNNLISNAIKYHDKQKAERFIEISAKKENDHTTLSISDNGTGIHPRYLDNIFDMFYRANERSDGSGLGLYIVKEMTEKLNGTIRVMSEENLGTTFTITLP